MNKDIGIASHLFSSYLEAQPTRERVVAIEHVVRMYDKAEEFSIPKAIDGLELLAQAALDLRELLMKAYVDEYNREVEG